MRILDNGMVEITNLSTGERKVVNPMELPNYGIPMDKYNEAFQETQIAKSGKTPLEWQKQIVQESSDPTQFEQEQALRQRLSSDIANKKTLSELQKDYVPKGFDPGELLTSYNVASPWGPAKETREQLLAMGLPENVVSTYRPKKTAAEVLEQKQAEKTTRIYSALDSLKDKVVDVPLWQRIPGLSKVSPNKASFDTAKNLLNLTLITLVADKRISDGERKAMLKNFPSVYDSKTVAQTKIDEIKAQVEVLTGMPSGNSSEWEVISQ